MHVFFLKAFYKTMTFYNVSTRSFQMSIRLCLTIKQEGGNVEINNSPQAGIEPHPPGAL